MDKKNLAVVRERFACAAVTHKTHEKEAEKEQLKASLFKILEIILISSSVTLMVFCNKYIAAIVAFIALCISIYQMASKHELLFEAHVSTAKKLRSLREEYISLITDILNNSITETEIIIKRDKIEEKASYIYEAAPQTSNSSYNKAIKALYKSNEGTSENSSINELLPPELRDML